MLKQIFQGAILRNVQIKNIRSLFTSNHYLADSEKPPPKENPLICPENSKTKGDSLVCKPDTAEKIKICVKPKAAPCEEQEPVRESRPCEDPCKNVVCKKERKKKEPKEEPVVDIAIEPLDVNQYDNYKIVIIGAGLAGLAAAKYFEENNIKNYVILEAQGRPGGRIHSEWFSDSVVELGASCSKSSNDTISFLQAAMADGLIRPPFSYMSIFKTCDGHTITSTASAIAYEIFKRIYCESLAFDVNPLDYINFRIEQEINHFPSNVRLDIARIMLGLLAMQNRKEGDNLKQFITRDRHISYLQSPGGRTRVPLGHFGIIQPMMDRIPQDKIKFCKPVQNIRWGAVVCKDTPRALVKCCDGAVYPADCVIITVSLGVLKEQHCTLFCPALPSETVEAIEAMGYQHLNRVFIKFCKPFWSWYPQAIDLKFTPSDTQEFCGWMRGLRSIQQVHGSNDVICVSVVGEEAIILEKLCESTLMDGVKELMKCNANVKKFPPVKCILRSRWSSNVYFNGAFSYLPECIPDGIQQLLASPLPGNNAPVNPILYFAGEATCPKLSGTIQAAKISGIREAARIKKIISNPSNVQTADVKLAMSC